MPVQPKFLLIPASDMLILKRESAGNPVLESIVMHVNESVPGCPKDIIDEYGYCPNICDGRTCYECRQEALEDANT